MRVQEVLMNFRKLLILGCLILTILTLTGCEDDTYVHLLGEEAARDAQDLANGATLEGSVDFRTMAREKTLALSDWTKMSVIWIIPASIIIGIFGLFTFKNTVWIKKMSIFLFIIGIPVLMLVITYGSAFLAAWFL